MIKRRYDYLAGVASSIDDVQESDDSRINKLGNELRIEVNPEKNRNSKTSTNIHEETNICDDKKLIKERIAKSNLKTLTINEERSSNNFTDIGDNHSISNKDKKNLSTNLNSGSNKRSLHYSEVRKYPPKGI